MRALPPLLLAYALFVRALRCSDGAFAWTALRRPPLRGGSVDASGQHALRAHNRPYMAWAEPELEHNRPFATLVGPERA